MGVTIPDNNATGIVGTTPISNVPSALRVIDTMHRTNIPHPRLGDLTLQIIAPDNTTVTIADRLGGSGDDYSYTTFWDGAERSITVGFAPFPGTFRPQNPFSVFNGKAANGTWRTRVMDRLSGEIGIWDWNMFWVLPD